MLLQRACCAIIQAGHAFSCNKCTMDIPNSGPSYLGQTAPSSECLADQVKGLDSRQKMWCKTVSTCQLRSAHSVQITDSQKTCLVTANHSSQRERERESSSTDTGVQKMQIAQPNKLSRNSLAAKKQPCKTILKQTKIQQSQLAWVTLTQPHTCLH